MKLYKTKNQDQFAIATTAGLGTDPFANHPDVWHGDECRWTFPLIPPIGSIIAAGSPGGAVRVSVERYDFTGAKEGIILVLITTPVTTPVR